MTDPLGAWEALKDDIPSDDSDAADALWDAGDLLADEVERLREGYRLLRRQIASRTILHSVVVAAVVDGMLKEEGSK